MLSFLFAAAPQFPPGLTWINVDQPLSLQALKGRVVLLDFWTYCCVNCLQVIPDLKAIESKYAQRGVVVIGVHSGKFDNEKDPENIRAAILRHEIRHPVVDDSEYKIWDAYDVKAWPTLIVLGSDGGVVLNVRGEGHKAEIEQAIDQALKDGKKRGDLNDAPMPLQLAQAKEKPLAFPGKIAAAKIDGKDHLFIADTNHNRIIDALASGEVVHAYGGFLHPQGVHYSDGTLYVADTENHLVRAIDLKTQAIRTIAGNGMKGRGAVGDALHVSLASPWDVLMLGGTLYIANAGTHQLLAYDPKTKQMTIAAGSGREGRIDGDAAAAALAQPSGLATDGRSLFFADSEVSSVRRYDPKTKQVTTIVGEDLFEFGDKDGALKTARLQHCLGLAFVGGALFVADTFNHKLKRIDLAQKTITSVYGTGKPGALFEPGGVAEAAGKLYVADTNNSRIVVWDPKTKAATELRLHP
ncbi:MAG: redoxin domain-containing protein [Deltaproteobacteria bacterium]|nr:redoxin domain-containing protein [Deltaproteobacteria bacterium]